MTPRARAWRSIGVGAHAPGAPAAPGERVAPGLLDRIDGWVLFLVTVGLFLLVIEVAFRVARRERRKHSEADAKAHVGVVLGALLGLLGLLLAFGFTIVDARFEHRKQLVVDEANAIGTTFLRAGMLPAPHRARVRELLRAYVDLRLEARSPADLPRLLRQSARLHDELWAEAEGAAARSDTPVVAIFVTSLNEMIDLQESRLSVALYQRMPFPFLVTLYLVATLAMALLGYSVGQMRARALPATTAAVLAVSLVMLLIVQLDRPWNTLFDVSRQPLSDVRDVMGAVRADGASVAHADQGRRRRVEAPARAGG